jgi:hypothetical protein
LGEEAVVGIRRFNYTNLGRRVLEEIGYPLER